jgi:cell division transport system ATP-binding protein
MLRLDNAFMRYGAGPEVLHDVNLALQRGDFFYMMGPTGAGKTSLLRILGLIHRPSRGRILMQERDVATMTREELAAQRRRIGMVFQDFRLLDHLSAYDNVALPLRISGGHDEQIGGFVSEMLAWLGLSEVIEAKPPQLSMGQRQLVAIARAVITRPNLLLCDEPTSNIDNKLARRLMHLFTQLGKLGTAIVLSTHNDDLVERYPHPILHMAKGRLTAPRHPQAVMAAAE